jgi:hypothetical protein
MMQHCKVAYLMIKVRTPFPTAVSVVLRRNTTMALSCKHVVCILNIRELQLHENLKPADPLNLVASELGLNFRISGFKNLINKS